MSSREHPLRTLVQSHEKGPAKGKRSRIRSKTLYSYAPGGKRKRSRMGPAQCVQNRDTRGVRGIRGGLPHAHPGRRRHADEPHFRHISPRWGGFCIAFHTLKWIFCSGFPLLRWIFALASPSWGGSELFARVSLSCGGLSPLASLSCGGFFCSGWSRLPGCHLEAQCDYTHPWSDFCLPSVS